MTIFCENPMTFSLLFSPGKPLIQIGKRLSKIQGAIKVLVFYVNNAGTI